MKKTVWLVQQWPDGYFRALNPTERVEWIGFALNELALRNQLKRVVKGKVTLFQQRQRDKLAEHLEKRYKEKPKEFEIRI